jgi:putative ABC transport system substrate-binding protein
MNRRSFIALLGGALAWPLAAKAGDMPRVRRLGVLMGLAPDDTESQVRLAAFAQGLHRVGWIMGQNIRADYRWGSGNVDIMRKHAADLIARGPEVILAHSSAAVASLLQESRAVPIVFTVVADPVAAGYVNSLARPGGNVTGFTNFEYSIGGKWLELLKEIAPNVTHVAVLRESFVAAGPGQFGAIQAMAQSQGIELRPIDLKDAHEIERDITAFAKDPNGGLIVTGSPAATVHRALINQLAMRHRLPIVFNSRFYVSSGGLISYGPDFVDQFRLAAGYVDRILKGESPAELPVQAPVKYELVVNLKTAKEMDLPIPPAVLARADDVIE